VNFYLARHASPDPDRKDLPYHIPPGPPLSTQGLSEAGELADFLYSKEVRHFISSPLERCLTTAQIAAQRCAENVLVNPDLMEVQPGESNADISSRMCRSFEQACLDFNQDSPFAFFTHGTPIAVLLRSLGMDAEVLKHFCVFDTGNPLPPAGVWEAEQKNSGGTWEFTLVFTPSTQQNQRIPT